MAVYTRIDQGELERLLDGLDLGRLKSYSGVADGLENSTYFVTTASGSTDKPQGPEKQWVLTVLEVENPQQTEFSVALIKLLCHKGLPVPPLAVNTRGEAVHQIAGKKALLASKAKGVHPGVLDDGQSVVTPQHCAAIGDFLGRMHRQSAAFTYRHDNPYGLAWAVSTAETLGSSLSPEDRLLIDGQLSRQQQLRMQSPEQDYVSSEQSNAMPTGLIHADLFRDNALFDGSRLSAVIDFQSACTDWLLLDVAIAVNDWASSVDGEIDSALAEALLNAYAKQRPFIQLERERWQDVLCFAALQFWLSRLLTQFLLSSPDGQSELTGRPSKDPEQYARMLRSRVRGLAPLLA
ncbi:MAG: phosphotransferase [Porticoccaceae bacterium]|nr:phosphotransferase [Porticoccaceae bacterium]